LINDDGSLSVDGTLGADDAILTQTMEYGAALVGKTVTLSLEVSEINGAISIQQHKNVQSTLNISAPGVHKITFDWDTSSNRIMINNTNSTHYTLRWAKLEIGGDATAFVPPDPATELVKCQRYFVRFGTRYGWFGTGFTSSTNRARLSQALPVSMRDGVERPTVTVHGTLYLNTPTKLGADAYALGDLIDSPILSENTICMGLVINDGAGLVEPCYGQLRDADSYIDISAEL